MRKHFLIGIICAVALMPAACTSVGGLAAGLAQATSTAIPQQATTLAEAMQAATLVTRAADTYVTTANPTVAQLRQIKALSDGVHAALISLEQANAAGHNLVFSSFNAAVAAFSAYKGH